MDGGIAKSQNAYRKQKPCTKTMVRLCNSIRRQKNRKQHTVLVVMYFESCNVKIWRAGLLHKASNKCINGKLWLYINNFIIDRKYYIQVNDYKQLHFSQLLVFHKVQLLALSYAICIQLTPCQI